MISSLLFKLSELNMQWEIKTKFIVSFSQKFKLSLGIQVLILYYDFYKVFFKHVWNIQQSWNNITVNIYILTS